jgi:hypothetical protein
LEKFEADIKGALGDELLTYLFLDRILSTEMEQLVFLLRSWHWSSGFEKCYSAFNSLQSTKYL